jgi:PRTRC genetic system ThiF family protein
MKYHQINNYLLDPPHKVTIALIGCGGTGSQVLSILARMNLSMIALGHPGFHVTAYDDDKVSDANIGRQLFSSTEIGSYKSVSLITRFNRFYGTNWQSKPHKYSIDEPVCERNYNIYITCVDDFKTRLRLAKFFKKSSHSTHSTEKMYWLDFGNTNNTGQAILGTLFKENVDPEEATEPEDVNRVKYLPCFDEWASLYPTPKPSENMPSCSLAEALEKQDLLINSSLANSGMQLLWRLFREGKTPYSGVIINLDSLSSNPIRV